MFIYDLQRAAGDLAFLRRAEMRRRDTARIKVWRMLGEKLNLILEGRFSVHAAAAASALHESTVSPQRHRKGLYQALADTQTVTILFLCLSFFNLLLYLSHL